MFKAKYFLCGYSLSVGYITLAILLGLGSGMVLLSAVRKEWFLLAYYVSGLFTISIAGIYGHVKDKPSFMYPFVLYEMGIFWLLLAFLFSSLLQFITFTSSTTFLHHQRFLSQVDAEVEYWIWISSCILLIGVQYYLTAVVYGYYKQRKQVTFGQPIIPNTILVKSDWLK